MIVCSAVKECCIILWHPLDYVQRKRETSDTDGESSLPNTPAVDDAKKEKKKKKKAKHQEADPGGLEQELQVEVWSLNWIDYWWLIFMLNGIMEGWSNTKHLT